MVVPPISGRPFCHYNTARVRADWKEINPPTKTFRSFHKKFAGLLTWCDASMNCTCSYRGANTHNTLLRLAASIPSTTLCYCRANTDKKKLLQYTVQHSWLLWSQYRQYAASISYAIHGYCRTQTGNALPPNRTKLVATAVSMPTVCWPVRINIDNKLAPNRTLLIPTGSTW